MAKQRVRQAAHRWAQEVLATKQKARVAWGRRHGSLAVALLAMLAERDAAVARPEAVAVG